MAGGTGSGSQSGSNSRPGSSSRKTTSESSSKKGSKSLTASANAAKCELCVKPFLEDDACIECEVCLKWFHAECIGILDAKLLDLFASLPGAHWSCSVCDKLGSRVLKLERKVDGIPNEIKKLNNSLGEIQSMFTNIVTPKLNSMEASYANVVKGLESNADVAKALEQNSIKVQENFAKQTSSLVSQLEIKEKSEKDSEFRAKNLILFGIKESENREDWAQQVDTIIRDCHSDMKVDRYNSYRLGRYDASKHKERPRPLRITTNSESQMFELLSRINGKHLSGIFARKDLSKKEQEEDFRLRKELKETRNANPDSVYKIKKGKITKMNN